MRTISIFSLAFFMLPFLICSQQPERVLPATQGRSQNFKLMLPEAYSDFVTWGEFDKTESKVLTCSYDNTAKLWDLRTGSMLLSLRGHGATIFFATFSPDGSKIATVSDDRTAIIWNAQALFFCLKLHP